MPSMLSIPTREQLSGLSMTRLEKLYAQHSKDERNVSLKHRRKNHEAMQAISRELASRGSALDDQLLQLRYAKAMLRVLVRTITSVKKYGTVPKS